MTFSLNWNQTYVLIIITFSESVSQNFVLDLAQRALLISVRMNHLVKVSQRSGKSYRF